MPNFLFWNLGERPLADSIVRLAARHEVDVFMLAECRIRPADLLRSLNPGERSEYFYSPNSLCERIEVYSRFSSTFIRPIRETQRLTIRHLRLPARGDLLLAVVHMQSKLHINEASQVQQCTALVREINEAEQQVGHQRTCLVGDLNMNPFEQGVVGAEGLHAVMSRRIASKKTRTIQGAEYTFFYNPMWGHFGDEPTTPPADTELRPPGTFYDWRSEHVTYFWNMFDQVMLRPDLLPMFSNDRLRILTSDGERSLLSEDGTPDAKAASDHLPLLFSLTY